MRKELLTFLLLLAISMGARAENATLDFSYAEGALQTYGKGTKGDMDVAIRIDDPSLAGKKITSIRAYISTAEGISNSSVWLSSELKLENTVNAPNICSIKVTPAQASGLLSRYYVLEAKLSEPYVLTESPVYVGYTFTVDDNSSDQQKHPFVISQGYNKDGFYLRTSKSVLKWTNYCETAGGVAYIVAELEGDYPPYAASLKGSSLAYANPNEDFQAIFDIANIGINPITSLKYTYNFDGGDNLEGSATPVNAIQPNLAATVPVSLNFKGCPTPGTHRLNVTITEVNGVVNSSAQPSITARVNVIPFRPTHRPLVEEYTGLWCGNCPRGYVAMEYIHEHYADEAVVVCFHNNDPMMVTNNYPMNVAGFPEGSIDRVAIIDPYWGSFNTSGYEMTILRDLKESIDALAIADINVIGHVEGSTVNITSDVTFIQDIDNANYQIGYILVANNLSDPEWEQANYYSGATAWTNTELKPFVTAGREVKGLIFNDVAIEVTAMKGVANSLPSSIAVGKTYTHNYNLSIENNALAKNINDLVITAFVIDKSTGIIVNANKCSLDPAGVESITDEDASLIDNAYYDLSGKKVANPSHGIFIKVEKYSNGKTKTSKVFLP